MTFLQLSSLIWLAVFLYAFSWSVWRYRRLTAPNIAYSIVFIPLAVAGVLVQFGFIEPLTFLQP